MFRETPPSMTAGINDMFFGNNGAVHPSVIVRLASCD